MNTERVNEYIGAFSKSYQASTEIEYGSSGMTLDERKSLKQMYRNAKQELGEEATREEIRRKIVESLVLEGWSQPNEMPAQLLGESARKHACVVAESLINKRLSNKDQIAAIESLYATYFSYTTKNQFDRYVQARLQKMGKMEAGDALRTEWFVPDSRDPHHVNPEVMYPEAVDCSRIYGISKPLRYLPAQFIKDIELKRLSSEANRKQFSIPWQEFDETLEQAETLEDIAVGIARKAVSVYVERGIPPQEIAALILSGYSPSGPMKEHGYRPEVVAMWHRLIIELDERGGQHAEVSKIIEDGARKKVESLGYSFEI